MTPKPTWVDSRSTPGNPLHDLGMPTSSAAATELVHERDQWVSSQMGISPRHERGVKGLMVIVSNDRVGNLGFVPL